MTAGSLLVSTLAGEVMDSTNAVWAATTMLAALNAGVHAITPNISWQELETTTTGVYGTQFYDLPAGTLNVFKVTMDLGPSNYAYHEYIKGWTIRHGSSTKKIALPIGASISEVGTIRSPYAFGGFYPAGRTIRIYYTKALDDVANSATAFTGRAVDERLIIEYAKSILYASRANRNITNPREVESYMKLSNFHRDLYEKEARINKMSHPTTIF